MEVRDSMLLPAYRASVVFERTSTFVNISNRAIFQLLRKRMRRNASGYKFRKQSALITCAMPLTCALSTKAQNISNYI